MAKRWLREHRRDQPYFAPVMQAVAKGLIALVIVDRHECPAPLAKMDATGLPSLLILMANETGPDDWPGLLATFDWAVKAYPAAYEMPVAAYEMLVEEAVLHRRFVWVETAPALVPAWNRAFGRRVERLEVSPVSRRSR